MNKLILHLGPPKTATTSLQYYYKDFDLSRKKAVYVGIIQPRQKHNDSGHNKLVQRIMSYSKRPNSDKLKKIHSIIDQFFINYNFIIISEEMLLHQENWMSRINNLHNLIKKYEHELIICLRDIRKALPFYYGEVFNNLPKNYQDNFNYFEKSKHSSIYDFNKLADRLKIFNKVNYIDFERLVNNLCYEKELLPGISNSNNNVVIGKQNTKKRTYNSDIIYITINVDRLKNLNVVLKKILSVLKFLRLSFIVSFIKNKLMYEKEVIIEISNYTKKIHERNQIFIKNLEIA